MREADVMVETSPAPAFVVAEAALLFEIEIIALDAPAQFGEPDQFGETRFRRQG